LKPEPGAGAQTLTNPGVNDGAQPDAAQARMLVSHAVAANPALREPALRREFGGPDTPEQNDAHAPP
jgi:hypothetical protein